MKAAAGGSNGVLDHDSNRNCAIDGIQREDIVWQTAPAAGTYEVWVDLFSACGKPAVSFTVSLWLPEAGADGGKHLVEQPPAGGGRARWPVRPTAERVPGSSSGPFNFQ